MDTKTSTGSLKSYLPILDWLPHDKSEWFRFDMIAALSVWALLVPQGIAYSSIAGVPAQYGLDAALGSLLGYALFAGLVYILLGMLRRGWISHFLSGAVLGGFVFGFGIRLIVDETPKILGVPKASGSYFQVLGGVLSSLSQTSISTLIVGVISIALLLYFCRYLPQLPRTIMVVVIGILVADLMGLETYGVSRVGPIPTGLPSFGWPTLPPVSLTSIVPGSLAIIFLGYNDSLNRKLMRKTGALAEIGEHNIHRTGRAAVAGAQKSAWEREVELLL